MQKLLDCNSTLNSELNLSIKDSLSSYCDGTHELISIGPKDEFISFFGP